MAPRARRTARWSGRKRPSYVESSATSSSATDGEDDYHIDDGDSEAGASAPPPPKVPRRGRPPRPRSKPASSPSKATASPRRMASRQAATHTPIHAPKSVPEIPSDGVVPNWTVLPYEILVSIFRHASYPQLSLAYNSTYSSCWLAQSLHICKAFVEPVVAVLYECPALRPLGTDPYLLLETLKAAEAGTTLFDYRRKVRSLKLNAADTLKYTVPGRGKFNLEELLPLVPLLNELDIAVDSDFPPFRARRTSDYSLPLSLFQALTNSGIKLHGWRWNGEMTSALSPSIVQEIHGSNVANGLRRLYLSHIAFVWPIDGTQEDRRALQAQWIAPLTDLEDLTLASCSNEDWSNMYYPPALKRLTLLNCNHFTSEHLTELLTSHGSQLRSLILSYNSALNLSFLTGLRTFCPHLENLQMDLTYFSSLLVTHEDTYPEFVYLLGDNEKPTWPSNLQRIELLNLRKWSLDAARNFFSSLVDSSKDLVDLRSLEIKAILNIGWRDRAGFRDHWISRLNNVFLRPSEPVSTHLASKKAFREWNRANGWVRKNLPIQKPQRLYESGSGAAETNSERQRHSSRLKDKEEAAVEAAVKATRTQRHRPTITKNDDHIQGACTHVDVSIDNQRPREMMFKEADFMDDEISGDEEWTGDRDEDTGYAW